MRFDEEIRFTRLTAGRKIHCESSSGSILEWVSSAVPRTSRGSEKVMIERSPSEASAASRMVERNLRTDSLPALFFRTISPSTVTSPHPLSRLSTSVAMASPFSLEALAPVSGMMASEAAITVTAASEAVVAVEVFMVFILSRKISSGGRKRKSTNSAKLSVMAVSRAMSRFTANPDWPRMAKPMTRPSEVTVSAMPTDLKA